MLLDGDKFNLFKSCACNFMFNLIHGLGESKTWKQVIKVAAKYGDDVIQYLAKYGDEVAKYIGKNGKNRLIDFIVKRADEIAQGVGNLIPDKGFSSFGKLKD